MVCGQCGTVAEPAARRCARCDSDLSASSDTVITLDSDAMTSAAGAGLTSGTSVPLDSLQPGHKFGTRYTIL
jgi:hypothetical protein